METDPRRQDDLSDLERRLSGWRPGAEGLDADAMLFAAGRAAGRHGRLLWPSLCGLLAVVAASLGVWGLSERAERKALASRMPESAAPRGSPDTLPDIYYSPSAGDYLSLMRQAEQDPNRWLASAPPESPPPREPPPERPMLHAGQREPWFNH